MAWTTAQQVAIDKRGSDILVSAAAGSGKTAVLTERVLRRIVGSPTEAGIPIDKFLIVTFTSAAANEMKERIGDKLSEHLHSLQQEAETPANDEKIHYLENQLALLPNASISTIHSFCLKTIKNYFQILDIDPAIKVGNQAELNLLQYEILEDLIEEAFEAENNQDFIAVLQNFASIRGVEPLVMVLLQIYRFSQSTIFPQRWLEEKVGLLTQNYQSLEETPWFASVWQYIRQYLEGICYYAQQAVQLAELPNGPETYQDVLRSDYTQLKSLMEMQNYHDLVKGIKNITFESLPRKKSDCDERLKEKAKDYRDNVKKEITKLKTEISALDDDKLIETITATGKNMETLVKLLKAFEVRYTQKKKEKGVVDYNDLEHLCLQLLIKPQEENGQVVGVTYTEVAKELSGFYEEVYIDEYQDSNMVQETLLKAIAKAAGPNGATRFMVGDMKQSIYRFRLANPTLFADKYQKGYKCMQEEILPEKADENLTVIDLSQNFRSRENILAATNDLFDQLMSEEVGELTYDEAARLRVGNTYTENFTDDLDDKISNAVELHLYDKSRAASLSQISESGEGEEENETAADIEIEAKLVAQLIEKLLLGEANPSQVFDNKLKVYRPVEPRDIVILLRSPKEKATVFEQALLEKGIGAYAEVGKNFFKTAEIRIMMDFLKILDNPMQDIPFIGILRSPIVGASYEDIVKIKTQNPQDYFYEAFVKYAKTQPKESYLNAFYELYHNLREEVMTLSVVDLLGQVFRQTGYWQYVGMQPRGLQKQANLKLLQTYAENFEKNTNGGLFAFLLYLDQLNRRDEKIEEAKLVGEAENLVKIMSIHKSKGLEFPIVILSNTAKAFNFQDSKENILMDSELGFGLKHLEEDVRYETLPFVAIKNKLVQETISEELRVLYVALTRAKEKLLITGVVKDLEKTAKSWALAANREGKNILPLALKKSPSYLKWIGIGLFALDGFEKLRDLTGEEVGYTFKGHSKWEMKIYPQDTTAQETLQTETAHEMPYDPKADWDIHQTYSTYKEAIDKQLNYTYPYQYAVTLPTKIAVSTLKKQEDFANLPNPFVKPEANSKPSLPQFMNPDVAGLSATDKGTLIHSLFEQVDFLTCTTSLEIQTRLNELAKQGKIDPLALKIVDIAKLAAFAQSPMLSRMQKAAAVYKEKQFVCLVSAQLVNPDCDPKEEILMQGVIDTFFIEPEGIVVIDYKTDYVDLKNQEASVAKIQQRYANQLHLYGEALSKILQKPVKEKWLYLYQANRWVEV